MIEFIPCLNTATIRPTPLLEKIKIAGKAGFKALEPWNDEVDSHLAKGGTLVEIRKAIDDAGLSVVSMIALHSWVDGDEAGLPKVLDEVRRRMDQAAALGSPTIVASPPRGKVDIAQAGARFAKLHEIGKLAGVKPSMEFLGFVEGVHTLKTAVAIAEASGVPNATVVPDIFHLVRGGGSIEDLLTISGKQMSIFHINDVPPMPAPLTQTDADRVLPGDGMVDLPRVIAIFRKIGYSGPLSLELFNRELWNQDPLEVVKRGIGRMQALVEG